jgi:hypothetical protein
MKTILASGAAVAALTAAMSMPASAECINGYETLGNNVVVMCQPGPTEFGAFSDEGMIPEDQFVEGEEPLYTGSIQTMEEPRPLPEDRFVAGPIEAAAVATEELVETPIEAAAVATEELVEEPIEAATFGEPMLTASAAAVEGNEVPGQIPDEPFFATEVVIATSVAECRPGQFWMADEVPIACPLQ